ncbi:hypothetical protein Tco_1253352 [Tanacetum coccineum]
MEESGAKDADLSRDRSGLKSPPEFQRSWCVEGHARSGVISSVLTQWSGCLPLHLHFLKLDLVKTYRIPLDLHPRLPDHGFTMDRLPANAIGIYFEFLWFSSVRVPFLKFLLSMLKYFKDVCMDDGPSSRKKWKNNFFLIDRRAVPDYLTWRHSFSCVSNDLPSDGYDRNDVQRLRARLIHLCEMREELLVRSGLKMSIYDFMTLSSWCDAKIVEESHHVSLLLLERVPLHTTTPIAEGDMVSLPTLDEIAASLPDPRLAKNRTLKKRKLKRKASEVDSNAPELGQSKGMDDANLIDFCAEIEDSLEKDEGAAVSVHARKSGVEVLRCQVDPLDFLARSALSSDVEYDQIPEDDFSAHALIVGVSQSILHFSLRSFGPLTVLRPHLLA